MEVIGQTEFYKRFDEHLAKQEPCKSDIERERIIWYMSHLTKYVKILDEQGITYGPDKQEGNEE